jgi:hypothetical protein
MSAEILKLDLIEKGRRKPYFRAGEIERWKFMIRLPDQPSQDDVRYGLRPMFELTPQKEPEHDSSHGQRHIVSWDPEIG